MKTLEEITQESARAVLDHYKIEIDEDVVGNDPVNILAWELGEGIGYETALREIVERAIQIDRAQRKLLEPLQDKHREVKQSPERFTPASDLP